MKALIFLIMFSSLFADTLINTNAYGIPFFVVVYAWIGIGTILIFNLLLNFNIIKSLPLSEGNQMKLFLIGLS